MPSEIKKLIPQITELSRQVTKLEEFLKYRSDFYITQTVAETLKVVTPSQVPGPFSLSMKLFTNIIQAEAINKTQQVFCKLKPSLAKIGEILGLITKQAEEILSSLKIESEKSTQCSSSEDVAHLNDFNLLKDSLAQLNKSIANIHSLELADIDVNHDKDVITQLPQIKFRLSGIFKEFNSSSANLVKKAILLTSSTGDSEVESKAVNNYQTSDSVKECEKPKISTLRSRNIFPPPSMPLLIEEPDKQRTATRYGTFKVSI